MSMILNAPIYLISLASLMASPEVIIGLITLAANVVITIVNYRVAAKEERINYQKRYFEKVFDTYLLKEIPNSRKLLVFNQEHKLTGINDFCGTLVSLRQDAVYFKYSRKDFYDELDRQLDDIEDFVMNAGNHQYDSEEAGGKFYAPLNERIEKFYGFVLDASQKLK